MYKFINFFSSKFFCVKKQCTFQNCKFIESKLFLLKSKKAGKVYENIIDWLCQKKSNL